MNDKLTKEEIKIREVPYVAAAVFAVDDPERKDHT